MSQPVYFLPRVQWQRGQSLSVTRSIIREAGLADIFSDVSEDHVAFASIDSRGPSGSSGTVIAYVDNREPPRRFGYFPEQQEWTAVGDGAQLWIGVDKDSRPNPDSLKRRQQYDGWPVELSDGKTYIIPVVRRPDGSTCLPTDMIFDAAGKLQEPIKPAYQTHWEASKEIAAWIPSLVTGTLGEIDKVKALRLAIQAFGLNYRYGLTEHNALRLIDATNLWTVLAMSVDTPRVLAEQESQKKT